MASERVIVMRPDTRGRLPFMMKVHDILSRDDRAVYRVYLTILKELRTEKATADDATKRVCDLLKSQPDIVDEFNALLPTTFSLGVRDPVGVEDLAEDDGYTPALWTLASHVLGMTGTASKRFKTREWDCEEGAVGNALSAESGDARHVSGPVHPEPGIGSSPVASSPSNLPDTPAQSESSSADNPVTKNSLNNRSHVVPTPSDSSSSDSTAPINGSFLEDPSTSKDDSVETPAPNSDSSSDTPAPKDEKSCVTPVPKNGSSSAPEPRIISFLEAPALNNGSFSDTTSPKNDSSHDNLEPINESSPDNSIPSNIISTNSTANNSGSSSDSTATSNGSSSYHSAPSNRSSPKTASPDGSVPISCPKVPVPSSGSSPDAPAPCCGTSPDAPAPCYGTSPDTPAPCSDISPDLQSLSLEEIQATSATAFMRKVQRRFQRQPVMYSRFLEIISEIRRQLSICTHGLRDSSAQVKTEMEVYEQFADVFRDHPDLVSEFRDQLFGPNKPNIGAED